MPEPYRGLNAALARNSGPSAEDVEALASVLDRHVTDAAFESGCRLSCGYDGDDLTHHMAERILASDWLAAHTAAAEARGAERGARAVVEWLTTDAAEEAAAAGIADYAYPGLSQVECERAANAALSTLATAAARVEGGA